MKTICLRNQIATLLSEYEKRIDELEQKLKWVPWESPAGSGLIGESLALRKACDDLKRILKTEEPEGSRA